MECSYYDPDQGWGPVLNANIITEGKGAGDSCSGKWDKLYYRGEIFSATHNLNVYYEYNLDSQYDPIISAAKSLLQQLESSNVATPCSSTEDSSSTGDTEDTSKPTTQPKLEPFSPTDDDTKDPRCPEEYPIYLESYGLCQADLAKDPRCPKEGTVYYEPTGGCVYTIKVPIVNRTPLSELNDHDEILEEGKRLAIHDKNYDKAILYFKKAIQLDPDSVRAYYNLAETLYNYLDKEASVEYYYKLLELVPSHLAAKRALEEMNLPLEQAPKQTEYDSWIKKGSDYLKAGNFDEAIRNFDLAYKKNPNDQNLINLKAEALHKKGMALMDEKKYDLAVIFLGESNHLKPDDFVKRLQNSAFNSWSDEIKKEATKFDPNVIDKFRFIEPLAPLPTVGKVSSGSVFLHRYSIEDANNPTAEIVTEGSPLAVGDVIFTFKDPVTIDWGHATTTLEPDTIFLIGETEHLQTFAKNNPHYIELVDGQIRIYDTLKKSFQGKTTFLLKVEKQPIQIGGTDVTITYDKTTGVSSIQIDDGTVKVYDVTTEEIKEFGAGTTLVTNNDGNYLKQAKERVPGWIKNNAKWWSDGQIGDTDFVGGIQYMIKEDIVSIPNLPEQASTTAEEHVPDWIRNNAGWWADGLISEDDFVSGIKWLVENGIIKV